MDRENSNLATFPDNDKELSLLDILIILAEHKKLIAGVALLFLLAGIVHAMLSAQSLYRSQIQMIPVRGTDYNIVRSVINSTPVYEAIVDKFNLTNRNGKEISRSSAIQNVGRSISIGVANNLLITVSVTTGEPELSRDIASSIYDITTARLIEMGAMPRDTPLGLQIASPATLPTQEVPQKPAKTLLLSAMLGIFCGVMAAFLRHFWTAPCDPETTEKKNQLKKLLGLKVKG